MQPLLPTLISVPTYASLTGSDSAGQYVVKKITGATLEIACSGRLEKSDANRGLILAALRQGPIKSKRQALTRLAAHKHMASNEAQLTLLLTDYTNDLDEFSEFVVLSVCDFYRRENTSRFMPTIAEMRATCKQLTFALRRELDRQTAPQDHLEAPHSDETGEVSPITPECNLRWLAVARTRNLTDEEIGAWKRGEMPEAENA